MNIRSNKGVTLVDISISIMIIFLFSSLITGLVYNYSLSTKSINRKAEATYQAINIIEALKSIDYEDIRNEISVDIGVEDITENNIEKTEENLYTFDITVLNNIRQKYDSSLETLNLIDGYSAVIKLEKYKDKEGNNDKEDIIIIATVEVSYMLGKKTNQQSVQLTTLLVGGMS